MTEFLGRTHQGVRPFLLLIFLLKAMNAPIVITYAMP